MLYEEKGITAADDDLSDVACGCRSICFTGNSSSLRPGSEIMNDPLYLRFVCLEQDEIFPEY